MSMQDRIAQGFLANAPRPSCTLCVKKHIAQAAVLFQEALQGYPGHRWLAIGHLAEAEAEIQEADEDYANEIRKQRKLAEEGDYVPDCIALLYRMQDVDGSEMYKVSSRVASRFMAWSRDDETFRSKEYVKEFANDMMSEIKSRYFKFESPKISPYGGQSFTVEGLSKDGGTGIELRVEFGTRTPKNYVGIGIGDPGRASGERNGRFASGEYPAKQGYKPAVRWFKKMIKEAEAKRQAERRTFTKEEMLKEIGAKPSHPVADAFEISDDGLHITVKSGSMTESGPINDSRDGWQGWVKTLKNVKRDWDRKLTEDSPTGLGMNKAKRKKLIKDLKRKNRGLFPMKGEIEWENYKGTKILTTWRFKMNRGVEYDDYLSDEVADVIDNQLWHLDGYFQPTNGVSYLKTKDRKDAGAVIHESESIR